MQCLMCQRTYALGNGHELAVSRQTVGVRGFALVYARRQGRRTTDEDVVAVPRQLCVDCRRFEVSLRVVRQDDRRMVVGVFVYTPRLATVLSGVAYTLEFERLAAV